MRDISWKVAVPLLALASVPGLLALRNVAPAVMAAITPAPPPPPITCKEATAQAGQAFAEGIAGAAICMDKGYGSACASRTQAKYDEAERIRNLACAREGWPKIK